MAKLIGNELPDDLYRRLSSNELESHLGKVILLSSIDPSGWPDPMMLTYFEVVAKDRHNIRLAPFKGGSLTINMQRNDKLTISIIDERLAYYIKGSVEELAREMTCAPHMSKLNLRVEQVLADHAHEEYESEAYVASGVRYTKPNLTADLPKARNVIQELLE